jgi:hypothetical protein
LGYLSLEHSIFLSAGVGKLLPSLIFSKNDI